MGIDGTEIFRAENSAYLFNFSALRFVCLATLSYTILGDSPAYYGTAFVSTITAALFVFMFTSADTSCKKIFLFFYKLCKRVQYVCVHFAYAVQYIFLKKTHRKLLYTMRAIS
ncbi:MAG: hypothetical protein L6V93_10455 [Clostridiales bacterium]|nr:MAG: hypothetical protein L6V93_10455 [Clostridiales bacterium]